MELNKSLSCDKDSLRCVQINVKGITSKKSEIKHLIDNCLFDSTLDVLLLCETWLILFSPMLHIPGYETFQRDRVGKKGGGVAILLSNKLRCVPLDVEFNHLNLRESL